VARKKIKLEEKAISEILVAGTDSESGAEASNVEDCFEEEKEEEDHHHRHRHRCHHHDHHHQQQQLAAAAAAAAAITSLSRNRTTGCNNWWITNLGTASRKEDKYSYFCQSSKRCEKK